MSATFNGVVLMVVFSAITAKADVLVRFSEATKGHDVQCNDKQFEQLVVAYEGVFGKSYYLETTPDHGKTTRVKFTLSSEIYVENRPGLFGQQREQCVLTDDVSGNVLKYGPAFLMSFGENTFVWYVVQMSDGSLRLSNHYSLNDILVRAGGELQANVKWQRIRHY